jgi:hypothetical protein
MFEALGWMFWPSPPAPLPPPLIPRKPAPAKAWGVGGGSGVTPADGYGIQWRFRVITNSFSVRL